MLLTRPRIAAAAIVAVAVILFTVFHQGNATANTGPPDTTGNPLAHLIVPSNEDPRIGLSWDAPDTPVSGYTITRTDAEEFPAAGAATTFSDHLVEPRTAYSYSVAAHNTEGASPASESASADAPDAPSAPGNLAGTVAEPEATDETATVTLTWVASTVPVAAPTDQTVAFSTQYTYRITGRYPIGANSSETSVTVFSQPVLPPTELTAAIADPFDGSVSLSWHTPNAEADIVGYMVFRHLRPDPYEGTDIPITPDELATQTVLLVPQTGSANTVFIDHTAQPGVTYEYGVAAYRDGHDDPLSPISHRAYARPWE